MQLCRGELKGRHWACQHTSSPGAIVLLDTVHSSTPTPTMARMRLDCHGLPSSHVQRPVIPPHTHYS
jgi:hypothetical protein